MVLLLKKMNTTDSNHNHTNTNQNEEVELQEVNLDFDVEANRTEITSSAETIRNVHVHADNTSDNSSGRHHNHNHNDNDNNNSRSTNPNPNSARPPPPHRPRPHPYLQRSHMQEQGYRTRPGGRDIEYRPVYLERFQSPKGGQSRRISNDPPVDDKTCLDVIISCGLGGQSFVLGSKFHDLQFRVRFASKIYSVLLVQLLFMIIWMSLVLTSQSFTEMQTDRNGIVLVTIAIYILINLLIRWTRCGGEGMCFMGYMVITIFVTTCLSIAAGGLVVTYPNFIYTVSGIWLTIVLLIVGNFSRQIHILSGLVYGWALVSAGLSSVCMTWIFHHLQPEHTTPPTGDLVYKAILPIGISVSLFSLFLVYETKKLVGGRRSDLDEHQWLLAALIL